MATHNKIEENGSQKSLDLDQEALNNLIEDKVAQNLKTLQEVSETLDN